MSERGLEDSVGGRAEVLASRPALRGRVLKVDVDLVRLPGGATCDLEVVRHPGAAAVVPVLDRNRVVLVRQYRHATDGWLLEVPAGKLDGDEPPEKCAARELEEEVGLRPDGLVDLGWIWPTPGFADEKIWLFLAPDPLPANQSLEDDEVLEVVEMDLEEAVSLARSGEIRDAKTALALIRAWDRLRSDGGIATTGGGASSGV